MLNHTKKPDFVLLSETWLNDSSVDLYGYESYIHSYICRKDKTGGGVSIFSKETYNIEIITELSDILTPSAESLFLKVHNLSTKRAAIIGIIYRPSNLPIVQSLTKFDQLLTRLKFLNMKFHLVGDYNIDLLTYPNGNKAREFLNTAIGHSVFPIVSLPTRVTKSLESLIDNHITNDVRILHRSRVIIIKDAITDHYPILVDIEQHDSPNHEWSANHRPRTQINLNDSTKTALCQQLSDANWADITSQSNCSANFSRFYHILQDIIKSILMVPVNTNFCPSRPWFNVTHHAAISQRNRLYQR